MDMALSEPKIKMRSLPVLFERKEECCGCTACFAICFQKAIGMFEDGEGFLYPKIDEKKCIRCYQCIEVCPIKAAKKLKLYNRKN